MDDCQCVAEEHDGGVAVRGPEKERVFHHFPSPLPESPLVLKNSFFLFFFKNLKGV